MSGYDVDHEVKLVQWHIKRLGKAVGDGTYQITFGDLFNDEKVEQIFESLVGSLKAAKRRNIIHFDGMLLLMPTHKDVIITLKVPLPDDEPEPHPPVPTAR